MNFRRYSPILLLMASLLVGCSGPTDIVRQTIDASWTVEFPTELGRVQESVTQGRHVMVVGDNGAAVLSAANGELLWSMPAGEIPFELSSAFLYNTSVVAIGPEGYVGWNIDTKEELFRSKPGSSVYDWAAFDDSLVAVEVRDNVAVMTGLAPESGDELWQHEMERPTFNLIPEGARNGYYTNAAVLPSDGKRVALWAKSADDPVHGEVRDVSTGRVDAVMASTSHGADKNQTFFSGPERFSEWSESADGSAQITTYDTATGTPVWDAKVDNVEGWLDGSAIFVERDGSRTALDAVSGDVLGSLGDTEDLILAADSETVYLSRFDEESVHIQAQGIEKSDILWSLPIEFDSESDPTTHIWSKISESHLVYHYRTVSQSETSESMTVVADRDNGTLLWLDGESIAPLSVDNGVAVATCAEGDCPPDSSTVAYFDLSRRA